MTMVLEKADGPSAPGYQFMIVLEHSVNAVFYGKMTDNNILSRFCNIDKMVK
jgi:hypothetical protein